MKNNVCAVATGYVFGLVPNSWVNDMDLKRIGAVHLNNCIYNLYKASTFEDSTRIDRILDQVKEYSIDEYQIEPVIIHGTLEMVFPNFDKNHDWLSWGGYEFEIDGKIIPFDFSGMNWNIKKDNDIYTIDFCSGDDWLSSDNYLWNEDDYYTDKYNEMELKLQDITANYLSQTTRIHEFFLSIEKNDREYTLEDITKVGKLALKELSFDNGSQSYEVNKEVLGEFNERYMNFKDYLKTIACKDDLSEMDKIQSIAQRQLVEQTHGNYEDMISFEKNGVTIVNPWLDETARFVVHPIETYGETLFNAFCNQVKEKLNAAKSQQQMAKPSSLDQQLQSFQNNHKDTIFSEKPISYDEPDR